MRSYRDLWLWLGALFLALVPFPAAIAIAYYAKLTHYSVLLNRWMLVSLVFFLAAFGCFWVLSRACASRRGKRSHSLMSRSISMESEILSQIVSSLSGEQAVTS